ATRSRATSGRRASRTRSSPHERAPGRGAPRASPWEDDPVSSEQRPHDQTEVFGVPDLPGADARERRGERRPRSVHDDPEAFLLEVISRADERLGTGAAEILGAVAGAALALFVPFAQGLVLRGVIGSAIGTLVGKKIAEHDPAWFRKRLELALD